MTTFEFKGKTYFFLYNGDAYFQVSSLLGDGDLTEVLNGNDMAKLCQLAAILAEQGELYRRWKGCTHQELLDGDDLRFTATPIDAVRLRMTLLEAVTSGLSRETSSEDEEIDLTLLEINKKKE
jgi:hypothetical protein